MEAKKKLEILIVEDDQIVSRLHKFSLSTCFKGDIKVCDNGREAIDHLDSVADQKDEILVLLDLNMPVMNGWEFLEISLSKHYAGKLHVIVVTSSSIKDDREKALDYYHVKAYYSKPLKKENFTDILKNCGISEIDSFRS